MCHFVDCMRLLQAERGDFLADAGPSSVKASYEESLQVARSNLPLSFPCLFSACSLPPVRLLLHTSQTGTTVVSLLPSQNIYKCPMCPGSYNKSLEVGWLVG